VVAAWPYYKRCNGARHAVASKRRGTGRFILAVSRDDPSRPSKHHSSVERMPLEPCAHYEPLPTASRWAQACTALGREPEVRRSGAGRAGGRIRIERVELEPRPLQAEAEKGSRDSVGKARGSGARVREGGGRGWAHESQAESEFQAEFAKHENFDHLRRASENCASGSGCLLERAKCDRYRVCSVHSVDTQSELAARKDMRRVQQLCSRESAVENGQ
jgi:hypothetical protein